MSLLREYEKLKSREGYAPTPPEALIYVNGEARR
jgi:hypothetical protein